MAVTLDDYTPGLTLYLCPLSPDGTQAWNGSAFVTASAAARNAGAVEGDEATSGNYEFEWPAGITAAGVYLFEVFNQLGGSPSSATDEEVVPSSMGTYTIPFEPGDTGTLAGEWRCAPAAEPQGGDRLSKNASDSRRYAFNFGDIEEIIAGQTITLATISATGGVTDTDTVVGTYRVSATFGGGTAGTDSLVTIAVTFSGGGSMTRTGTLVIT